MSDIKTLQSQRQEEAKRQLDRAERDIAFEKEVAATMLNEFNITQDQKDFSRQLIDDVDLKDLDKDEDYVRLVQLSQANWLRYENRYNTALKS
jgi:hypothetical protein